MSNENPVDPKELSITTSTVEIKIIQVSGRKFTLATFRQIPMVYNIPGSWIFYLIDQGKILGTVKYYELPNGIFKSNDYSVLFQIEGRLYRLNRSDVRPLIMKDLDFKFYSRDPVKLEAFTEIIYDVYYTPAYHQLFIAT